MYTYHTVNFLGMCSSGQGKQETTELQEKSKGLKAAIVAAEEDVKAAETTRDKTIMLIGNLVPDSVPVSNDEVCRLVDVSNAFTHLVSMCASATLHMLRAVLGLAD